MEQGDLALRAAAAPGRTPGGTDEVVGVPGPDRQAPVRIALVAGEPSGDALGARLVEALRARLPAARFFGIGGPKMTAAGVESWFPMDALAVHGLVEVVRHIGDLLKLRRTLIRRLVAERPDVFIGVDAPDFNLGVERRLKRAGITTIHFVSPTIWAWRPGRIETIRKAVTHMLLIFPFEEEIYRAAGVPATFVGHPLADGIPERIDRDGARAELRLGGPGKVVAILPGSRRSELAQLAELFIEAAKRVHREMPDTRFLVPLVTRETRAQFEEAIYRCDADALPLSLLFGHAPDALAACDAALAASGTVTLEAAFSRRPMVIAYRVKPLSYRIMKRLIRIPYIGMPNILSREWVVPEFVQEDATPENLAQALVNMLRDESYSRAVERRFAALHASMRCGAAERAADAIFDVLGFVRTR